MKRAPLILSALLLTLAPAAGAEDTVSAAPLFAARLWDTQDKPVALEKFRGKALIVNFWARWCAPCRDEIPELIKAQAAYKGRGVEVIGIGIEDRAEPVRQFAAAQGMNYPVLIAKQHGLPLMQALGNRLGGLPYTLVIAPSGKVLSSKLGALKKADLDAAAEALAKR